jgi:TolB protein
VYDAATGQYRPYAYDSALASVTALSNDFAGSSVFSPDGTRIVQSIYQDNAWQVIVKNATAAAAIAQGTAPVWGPTGFIAYQGCSDTCGIHVINPDQPGSLRRLTSSSSDIAFKWSPQGDRVVYMSNVNGAWEIYIAGLNGDFRQLTGLGSSSGAPAWSPDGAQIAFLSNRDGNFGLFVMNADGSNLQKVADFGAAIPAWQTDKSAWTR